MSNPFAARVRVPEDILVSELDGESVMLNLRSESYFGLDEVGTRIWQLLLASDSIQAAYDAVLSEFDVDPDRLRADLTELLDHLVQHGLLEISPETSEAAR